MSLIDEFRNNDTKRKALDRLLKDSVLQEALGLLDKFYKPSVPRYGGVDPALALALSHAFCTGGNDALDRLRLLTKAPSAEPMKPPVEWGILKDDLNVGKRTRSKKVA